MNPHGYIHRVKTFSNELIKMFSFVLSFTALGVNCHPPPMETVRDLGGHFQGLTGAFVLFDNNSNSYVRHNPIQCQRRYSPASTFKVCNSLIGLETGVIPDEHFVIPWDSVQREIMDWNRDHDLRSAFKYSVVPYYQELARRVGAKRMKKYVEETRYGNMDISGGIDKFWLGSSLLISADEQVLFLKNLHDNNLPFSQRSMDVVKDILIVEKNGEYVYRGKTGTTTFDQGMLIGWFIGYLERGGNAYFFALNMITDNPQQDVDKIFSSRKEITKAILKELGLM
jgi:beta-lactamase class D